MRKREDVGLMGPENEERTDEKRRGSMGRGSERTRGEGGEVRG